MQDRKSIQGLHKSGRLQHVNARCENKEAAVSEKQNTKRSPSNQQDEEKTVEVIAFLARTGVQATVESTISFYCTFHSWTKLGMAKMQIEVGNTCRWFWKNCRRLARIRTQWKSTNGFTFNQQLGQACIKIKKEKRLLKKKHKSYESQSLGCRRESSSDQRTNQSGRTERTRQSPTGQNHSDKPMLFRATKKISQVTEKFGRIQGKEELSFNEKQEKLCEMHNDKAVSRSQKRRQCIRTEMDMSMARLSRGVPTKIREESKAFQVCSQAETHTT